MTKHKHSFPRHAARLRHTPRALPSMQKLAQAGIPWILMEVVLAICTHPAILMLTSIDAAELFAGDMAITEALRRFSYLCVPMDIRYAPEAMNILTPAGFGLALTLVLRMAMNGKGLLWLAPVCSSWVFMSAGSTDRCRYFPLGNQSEESTCVKDANIMYARCILLCKLAAALGLTYILEQPLSSVMNCAPRFQQLMTDSCMWMASPVHMGAYGGGSKKSLKLFCNEPWVSELVRPLPRGFVATGKKLTKRYIGPDGVKKSDWWPRS